MYLKSYVQGVQKLNLPFKSFVVLKVNLQLQHQNHNLLEETCRIFFDTKHVSIGTF